MAISNAGRDAGGLASNLIFILCGTFLNMKSGLKWIVSNIIHIMCFV